jgi:hypothetical protein
VTVAIEITIRLIESGHPDLRGKLPAMSKEYRASNGIIYRIEGEGEPLLLLHGLMVAGGMFDPLVALLRDQFRLMRA